MKVKNFIAANMNEAISMVRQELGSEAVILSNQTISGKVYLTAALDETVDFDFMPDETLKSVNIQTFFDDRRLREALEYHGVTEDIAQKILASSRQSARDKNALDEQQVLSGGLERLYKFDSLLGSKQKVKLFMGTPGSGKSTAIAKMATQAKFKKMRTAIISTDNVRAGANNQLQAFAKILEVDFYFEKEAKNLFRQTQLLSETYDLILIDTAGINPFVPEETDKVLPFADCIKGDKFMVMDAGRNVPEAIEAAEIFKDMGADYLLPTRLDMTRRLGAVLSAAGCCRLAFCAAGVNASIANGLAVVSSAALARLILAE